MGERREKKREVKIVREHGNVDIETLDKYRRIYVDENKRNGDVYSLHFQSIDRYRHKTVCTARDINIDIYIDTHMHRSYMNRELNTDIDTDTDISASAHHSQNKLLQHSILLTRPRE